MRTILRSSVLVMAVAGAMLVADATVQAQQRRGGGSGRASAGVRYNAGRYDGNRNYNRNYNNRSYNRNDWRYYANRYGNYGNRSYYGTYPRSSYNYPRVSYYGGAAARYSYYTSNGWRVCYDRYSGNYWYLSGGYWYRWY